MNFANFNISSLKPFHDGFQNRSALHCIAEFSSPQIRSNYGKMFVWVLASLPTYITTFQQESLLERRRDEIRERDRLDLFEASGQVQVCELAFRFRRRGG